MNKYANELREKARTCYYLSIGDKCPILDEIISRYQPSQPAESLAVLADRKGFEGIQIFASRSNRGWVINLIINGVERTISAYEMTYPEAEAKAREYLNGLPDKGEK